jgi:hypothetical protein
MTEKTHYRKAFNSPYLSSADITGPTRLTVKCVRLEKDRTKKTKDEFNTAYFVEKEIRVGEILKPMILNATNSKMMKTLTGSAFIDDWNDVPVTVYVDPSVRFGRETVEGLRVAKGEKAVTAAQYAQLEQLAEGHDDRINFLAQRGESLTVEQAETAIRKWAA